MTDTMKAKEIYFDDLVKDNILSFLPFRQVFYE